MLTRRQAWLVAIVATLTMTVSYVDRSTLSILAPEVTRALHISNEAYGWLTSAFSLAYLIGTPLAGWWIDRAGVRRGLILSVLAWSAVAALHAVVPGFAVLFALRLALGITEGPGFPGAAQTVQRILPAGDRERGFGVLFTGSSLGTALVPLMAALVYRLAGWRTAFLITTAAGLVWIPLWIAVTRRPEVRAQLAVAAPSPTVSRPAFRELITHPIMLRALAAIFAAAPIFGFPVAWGSKYLNSTFQVSQGDVGDYLWLPPVMFDVTAVLFGHLASIQRRAEGAPARGLLAAATLLCATLALLPVTTTPWQSTVLMGVAMGGSGAVYTLVTADLLGRMPPGSTSFAAGILACAQSVALLICSPLIGRSVDQRASYAAAAIFLGLWAIPGCVVWLLWRPPVRFITRVRARTAG